MKNKVLIRLLSLLRAGLSDALPDAAKFAWMRKVCWKTLYMRAAQEGVLAWTFDGMLRLPKNRQPPCNLQLNWHGSVDFVERKYICMQEAAQELSCRFGEQGIRMLLFKGFALAQYHQKPSHREFGDLDIYLFGQYDDGNRLLREWGAQEMSGTGKHAVFSYNGVMVENHISFLEPSPYIHADLDRYLIALVHEEHHHSPAGKLQYPSPDFTLLYFVAHALEHLMDERLRWRYFCDWAVFLHASNGQLSWSQYELMFPRGSISRKVADAFTAIAIECLELPPDKAPPHQRNQSFERTILKEISYPFHHRKEKLPFGKHLIFKYRWLMERRWRSELLVPGSFRKNLIHSLIYRLHPFHND
ncbi:MAG: nucleotidyltransferase family protein [Bacteroidales bacterium]|jgi:hypothetical protein|nr:nucleotidyltransferase family protein [Bacteroidales bacterium]